MSIARRVESDKTMLPKSGRAPVGFAGWLLVVLVLSACATSRRDYPPGGQAERFEGRPALRNQDVGLSTEEQALALEIGEAFLVSRGAIVQEDGRYFAIGAELFRDKQDTIPTRKAVATFYRYAGDLTLLSYVNLTTRQVFDVDSIANLPTALSAAELERARRLALDDTRVVSALGQYVDSVTVEGLVLHAPTAEDRFFGKRVVTLLFRVGRDYVKTPDVIVDLTDEEVMVGEPVD